jgi:hypothetical protein
MLEKIKTWLPVFHGFYGSGLEQDNDLDCLVFVEPDCEELDKDYKQWLLDEVTDFIDYSSYHKALAEAICGGVCDELESHELIKDYEFESLSSPKYYNFSNDSINVIVEVDIESLITQCEEKIEEFTEYLKERYTSCSGFISSYSNDPQVWFGTLDDYTDGLIHNDTGHCIGSLLNFLLTGQDDNCYQDLVYEATTEVDISEYLNWDGLLEGFNEEFGTDAKCIMDIESGDINELDPEVIARRDIAGQKHFVF